MKPEVRIGLGLLAVILAACVALFPPLAQMTDEHLGLLMLALVVFVIMLGFPAAFTMMGMGMIFALMAFDGDLSPTLNLMVQRAYATMSSDVLIAIPLFVFMGYVVERASLIERLFHALNLAMARLPGALAIAALATCALFATATGIIGAVVTVMGLLAMPTMLRAGYSVRLTSGVITAGGCLGVLIPPSILLIVYSATAGVSVVRLYAGALFPGLLLTLLYAGYILLVAKLRPSAAPPLSPEERQVALPAFARGLSAGARDRALPVMLTALKGKRNADVQTADLLRYLVIFLVPLVAIVAMLGFSVRQFGAAGAAVPASGGLWAAGAVAAALLAGFYGWFSLARLEILKMLLASFFPLAILIGSVLGSIILGVATPNEAAAVGALGGMLLALAYGRLNFRTLRDSARLTAKTSAMVCWLFVGSSVFSAAFALLGGQALIERWVLSMDLSPLQFMILAQLVIFLLGWPLDWAEIIVIFVPIFLPLLPHFGIDPLFFGLLVALNLQTAYLSPPVAMSAFYLRGVAPPGVTLNQIFAGMLPFMGLQILALVLLYCFPEIGLWLPGKMYD